MTGNDEALSMRAIEVVRGLQRKAATACEAKGITLEDAALGSVYAAFDIAQRFKGDPYAGIEWLRTGMDVIERQLLNRETKQ
jgi:hypothetical protein